jgi:hypothetical protein
MSPTMSWAELLIMACAISVSLAVMIALVFYADRQPNGGRTHAGEPGGKRHHAAKR